MRQPSVLLCIDSAAVTSWIIQLVPAMIRGRKEGSNYSTWFIGFDHGESPGPLCGSSFVRVPTRICIHMCDAAAPVGLLTALAA